MNSNTQLNGHKFINSVGMTMTLISFSMLFATMFLGYTVFRSTSSTWPPMGMDRVSLGFPIASTLIIFISSCFLYFFEHKFKVYSVLKRRFFLGLTVLFGSFFLISQISLWASLSSKGIYASSGIFASLIYAFTWVHAAHIVLGILSLLYLIKFVIRDDYNELEILKIKNVSKFWHFLGIMWFFIFITIFVF